MHRGHDHDHHHHGNGAAGAGPQSRAAAAAPCSGRRRICRPDREHDARARHEPDLDLVEMAFVEGFATATDPTSFLRLARIPFEAVDGRRRQARAAARRESTRSPMSAR